MIFIIVRHLCAICQNSLCYCNEKKDLRPSETDCLVKKAPYNAQEYIKSQFHPIPMIPHVIHQISQVTCGGYKDANKTSQQFEFALENSFLNGYKGLAQGVLDMKHISVTDSVKRPDVH